MFQLAILCSLLFWSTHKYLDQIKLFNDKNDIDELMGFPERFYEKHGKRSPFTVLSASPSNENLNSNVLVMTI